MTHTYDTLPPPPDGYGDWHQWDAEAFERQDKTYGAMPSFLSDKDPVFYAMQSGEISLTADEAYLFDWTECGGFTITHFCLPFTHPYNHSVPEPIKPKVDMTGMDETELWGVF